MKPDKAEFLNLKRLPASLNREEVSWLLGWDNPEEVTIVTSARHLKALGKPNRNGKKLYATKEVEQLMTEVKWLNEARSIIQSFWIRKNEGREDHGQ